MADNKVLIEFQIVQKGESISVVQKETDKLRKTQDQTAQSTKNLTKQQDIGYGRQKQALVQTANSTKNFSKLANTIDGNQGTSLVGAYATLAANVFAATAAFNALARAARFEQLRTGLEQLGTSSGRTLSILATELKEVTGNALTLEQSFRSAALGISGGFGAEELTGLAKIARGASITLGRDLADAFDRLTRGAIKLEPEILDELGIMVRLDDAVEKYATQLGKTAGSLSQTERRQAFMNEILVQGIEKFGEIADTVEPTIYDQLGASFGDLTRQIFTAANAIFAFPIKLLTDNTLLLSAALLAFGSTLSKQIVPGIVNAGGAAGAYANKLLASAEATKLQTELAKSGFISQLTAMKSNNKQIEKFRKLIGGGNADLKTFEDMQKAVNNSLRGFAAAQTKNQTINTVSLAQREREKQLLAELILLENAKGAAATRAAQAVIAANAAQNAANVLTQFTVGATSFTGAIKGISAAGNVLGAELTEVAQKALKNGQSMSFLTKQMIKGQVAGFKFANTMRLIGATFVAMLPQIAAVLAIIGVGVLLFNRFFNTKEQQEFIKGQKELRTILEELPKKAEEFAKSQESLLPIASQQLKQFDILSNSLSEINEKLKEQIRLQKLANESRVIPNRVGLTSGAAREAAEEIFLPREVQRSEFDTPYTPPRLETVNLPGTGQQGLDKAFGEGVISLREINILQGELLRKFSQADVIGRGIVKNLPIDSISSIFEIKDSDAFNSFKTILQSEIPGQAEALKASLDLEKLIANGATITEEMLVKAIDRANEKTKNLNDNFRGLNGTIKDAEKEASRFIQSIAPKTKVDGIALQFESIGKEMVASFDSATKAGLDGATEIGRAFSAIGPNIARILGPEFVTQLKAVKDIESEIRDVRLDPELSEEEREKKIKELNVELDKQLKLLGGQQQTVEDTFKLILNIQKAEITRVATLKSLSALTGQIKSFEAAGKSASQIRLDIDRKTFGIKEKQLADERTLLENTFTGLKVNGQILDIEEFKKKSLDEQLKIAKDNGIELRNVFALQNQSQKESNLEFEKSLALAAPIQQASLVTLKANEKLAQVKKQIAASEAKQAEAQARLNKFARTGSGDLNEKETFDLQVTAARKALTQAKQEAKIKKDIIDAELAVQKARLAIVAAEAKTRGVDIDVPAVETALTNAADLSKDLIDDQLEETKNNLAITIMEGFKKGGELSAEGNVFDGYRTALAAAMSEEGTGGASITLMESFGLASNIVGSFTEQLKELGPEGEAIIAMSTGFLKVGESIAILADKNATAGEKLTAAKDMFAAVGAAQQAQAKAQVAAIDQAIEAEKRRDGKSKESVAKIKEMEKKKEAIQRKAFEQNKKIQLAQAVINGMSAIQSGYATQPFFPLGLMMGTLAVAMTAAQIKAIRAQKFQGGAQEPQAQTTALSIGSRSNAVDVSQRATGGELNYLRGGRTTGTNLGGAGGSLPGGSMGRRGYAMGGEGIVVGERGPEVVTPSAPIDITPNFALGGGTSNVNFTINAVDAAGVEDVLTNQRGNIIRMIREAANENGERFLETIDTQAYGSNK